MLYEWDERKAAANLAKHSVAFEAAYRFEWQTSVVRADDREDYGELRLIATGFIGVRLHVLVCAPVDEDTMRVISLRKANKGEQNEYRETQA